MTVLIYKRLDLVSVYNINTAAFRKAAVFPSSGGKDMKIFLLGCN
jgi:hypothetical protein